MDTTAPFRIVVGVDGSANSRRALQWALDEAAVRGGGTVTAIMTWAYAPVTAVGFGFGGPMAPAESMDDATREALEEIVGEFDAPDGVELRAEVRQGSAAGVLIDASEDADLLVIGKRGIGGFLGLLVGSVANHVSNHANVPVVVVPTHEDD